MNLLFIYYLFYLDLYLYYGKTMFIQLQVKLGSDRILGFCILVLHPFLTPKRCHWPPGRAPMSHRTYGTICHLFWAL